MAVPLCRPSSTTLLLATTLFYLSLNSQAVINRCESASTELRLKKKLGITVACLMLASYLNLCSHSITWIFSQLEHKHLDIWKADAQAFQIFHECLAPYDTEARHFFPLKTEHRYLN